MLLFLVRVAAYLKPPTRFSSVYSSPSSIVGGWAVGEQREESPTLCL